VALGDELTMSIAQPDGSLVLSSTTEEL
jgi:hypothetical protein